MIVDLKHKQWYLLSLFPLLCWTVLLSNFNYFFLSMALFGVILTGYKVARDEWFEGMERLRKTDFVAFDTRFKKTMNIPIFQFFELSLIFYGIGSLVFYNVYMFNHISDMPYYAWMLLFLTWATIIYGFLMLFFVPEYWEAVKNGAAYGYYSDNAGYWIGRGFACYSKKNYEEAIDNFDKALEIDKKFLPTLGLKGETLMKMKKWNEAIQTFDKALEIDPKNVQIIYQKGNSLRALGKYTEAIQNFEKVIEYEPNNLKAWGNRGFTLEALGKYEEAIQSFDKAVEIDPKNTINLLLKGRTLIKLERLDEAIVVFDKALDINPKYVDAWGNRGAALDQLKRYSDAIQSYDKALEIDPNNAKTWYNRGLTIVKMGKFDVAIQNINKAIQIDPNYSEAIVLREEILNELKKRD